MGTARSSGVLRELDLVKIATIRVVERIARNAAVFVEYG